MPIGLHDFVSPKGHLQNPRKQQRRGLALLSTFNIYVIFAGAEQQQQHASRCCSMRLKRARECVPVPSSGRIACAVRRLANPSANVARYPGSQSWALVTRFACVLSSKAPMRCVSGFPTPQFCSVEVPQLALSRSCSLFPFPSLPTLPFSLSFSVRVRLWAGVGLSPLHILTLCGSERVLVVSTEPLDDLSCLTTQGSAVLETGCCPCR